MMCVCVERVGFLWFEDVEHSVVAELCLKDRQGPGFASGFHLKCKIGDLLFSSSEIHFLHLN